LTGCHIALKFGALWQLGIDLMLDHLSLGVTDLGRAMRFYDAAFAPLGYARRLSTAREAAYGPEGAPTFWLYPMEPGESVVGAGTHIAIAGPDRMSVEAAHAAAIAAGGISVRSPAKRPEISENYFGAVILDPDGHKLEFVAAN
jgi:catechol 2,3-dioxygenase-like lactoylglutathione lyase family enzyme